MFAEFIHFYPGYTVSTALQEYAITFYTMLGAMYRLKAQDRLEDTYSRASAAAGGEALTGYIKNQETQAGGAHALLEEVKAVKTRQK